MRSTFNILFYVNRSKERKGLVPVLCRVTVSGTVAQFSCKLSVPLSDWDPKAGKLVGKGRQIPIINGILDGIRARVTVIYHELAFRGETRTAGKIKEVYFGKIGTGKTVLEALERHIEAIESRVGKDRASSTLNKYRVVHRHLSDFIQWKYHRKDIFLGELDEAFIRCYCNFLRDEVGVSQSSVWVYQMPLRTVVTSAFNEGIISKNPFTQFHVSPDVKERQFLTEKQLSKLMDFNSPRKKALNQVRDMFLFSCFTGLSFIDLKKLKSNDIVEINGSHWIIARRQKTGVHFQAKLLPISMAIIKKYGNMQPGKPLFDVGEYCTVNKRLKRVGILSGVSDNLTFHMGRHTFATLALSKGMSMESLKQVLGHTDLQTTQIYAKITSTRLEQDYTHLTKEY